MASPPKPHPRVAEHVDTLRAAGLDPEAFFDALVGIRDDTLLKPAHREALYRLVASECFIWYLEALRGEPIDRIKLMQESARILEARAVAIMKEMEKESAAEQLVKADISKQKPGAPDPEATRVDRPPVSKARPNPARPPAAKPTGARPQPSARRPGARAPKANEPTRIDRPPKKKE